MNTVRFLALLPRNACVAVLRAYRATVSPLYGDVCRYYPSCSTYTLHAIQQQGAVKGIALGAWRILRCNPWSQGGIDDAPHSHSHAIRVLSNGFVAPGDDLTTTAPSLGAEASPHESVSSTETQLVGSTRKG